jgi:hypothetical protein
MGKTTSNNEFPFDPLDQLARRVDYRRRLISGILESYNSNYDALAEAVQNAIDALEDAKLSGLPSPFLIEVKINLKENWIGVLDTGIGMDRPQVCAALAPSVSFKDSPKLLKKRSKVGAYRGYKGVGLTFLAYGSDDVALHSKQDGDLTKARIQYGRAWVHGERDDAPQVVEDPRPSPLGKLRRGTYIEVHFSNKTLPRSLLRISPRPEVWKVILRTRTALGQVLLGRDEILKFKVRLEIIDNAGTAHSYELAPTFLYPHEVVRSPAFKFLDLAKYYRAHPEKSQPAQEKPRQDGLYMVWNTQRIESELLEHDRDQFKGELEKYTPSLYSFMPYQGSVWGEMNGLLTGEKRRSHLYPGLVLAVNRQRLADVFEIGPSRFETLSRNILVVVHFDNARPDQGRKTLQDEVLDLAKKAADRAVQYLADQRAFLRPPGESPTPEQREVERDHGDWMYNVKKHAELAPLHMPPTTFVSIPLTEQDVVGLFHQLSALGVFAGIKIYATSQRQTYDCLIQYDCHRDSVGLRYGGVDDNPLGLSPYVLGEDDQFVTKQLTLEFKNNLDGLIDDLDVQKSKSFKHLDICVCWATVDSSFPGYSLEEITETNLDERQFPGATHLLAKDGETHVIQVIMLKKIAEIIEAGHIKLA